MAIYFLNHHFILPQGREATVFIPLSIIAESWFYNKKLSVAIAEETLFFSIFWAWSFLFSFVHIFLVIKDTRSRYQNYKRVKDQFFIHSFSPHLAQHFIGSSCQRRAVTIAARELAIEKEVKDFYCSKDVQSYHFIPYRLLKNPLFVFILLHTNFS